MEFNLNPGRLRNPVELLTQPTGSDDDGQPLPRTVLLQAWADVDVKNGAQLTQMGEEMTSEVITALMYYDERVTNSGWIKDGLSGIVYQIQHVRPGPNRQAMIVTAQVETK
jgi:head-tail adaptor